MNKRGFSRGVSRGVSGYPALRRTAFVAWLATPFALAAPLAWAQPMAAARPGTELRIIEDDQVRIEETRVRGQLQRITVAPKGPPGSTMRAYEINVGAGGRDPSQDKSSAGQRVWSVLKF